MFFIGGGSSQITDNSLKIFLNYFILRCLDESIACTRELASLSIFFGNVGIIPGMCRSWVITYKTGNISTTTNFFEFSAIRQQVMRGALSIAALESSSAIHAFQIH